MKEIIVKFYFTSALETSVSFTKEQFDDLISKMNQDWSEVCMVGSSYGINVAHVTHYEVVE